MRTHEQNKFRSAVYHDKQKKKDKTTNVTAIRNIPQQAQTKFVCF